MALRALIISSAPTLIPVRVGSGIVHIPSKRTTVLTVGRGATSGAREAPLSESLYRLEFVFNGSAAHLGGPHPDNSSFQRTAPTAIPGRGGSGIGHSPSKRTTVPTVAREATSVHYVIEINGNIRTVKETG